MRSAGNGVGLAIVVVALIAALAGCSAGDAPPGTPGSLTTHMNGRMESGFGGWP
jgi:hypothetical protein